MPGTCTYRRDPGDIWIQITTCDGKADRPICPPAPNSQTSGGTVVRGFAHEADFLTGVRAALADTAFEFRAGDTIHVDCTATAAIPTAAAGPGDQPSSATAFGFVPMEFEYHRDGAPLGKFRLTPRADQAVPGVEVIN